MSGVQSQKFTRNSAWIARFEAKLAYMYEVCSTYIHISMCSDVCIHLRRRHRYYKKMACVNATVTDPRI